MSDKKIIINGVDVSECKFIEERVLSNGYSCGAQSQYYHIRYECNENPNCYFKQLKRKEQACKDKESLIQQFFKDFDLLNERYINSFPDFVKETDKIILDITNKAKET